jgi:threonine/homoserine/homoserine lactone efflux protein
VATAGLGWRDKVTNEKRRSPKKAGDGRKETPILSVSSFRQGYKLQCLNLKLFFFSVKILGLYVHKSLEASIYREIVQGKVLVAHQKK